MKKYIFEDTDYTGEAEYDISGDDYFVFLEICFKYCASVAFGKAPYTHPMPDDLEKFRLQTVYDNLDAFEHHYSLSSPEVREYVRSVTDSIFKWITGRGYDNPDDLTFIRADGTRFFSSIIHEGFCCLTVRDDEDVSGILALGEWNEIEEGYYFRHIDATTKLKGF